MAEKTADPTIASKVEHAVRRLNSLSTLPCIAARVISELAQAQFSPSALAETIESDPALAARVFSLLHEQGRSLVTEKASFRQVLEKLPAHTVRDAILSVRASQFLDNGFDDNGTLLRNQLIRHSIAVGCCAKDIAEILSPMIEPHLAYPAGLLHDIGKLALQEVMPKSFARMAEEARAQSSSTCSVENRRLGVDHTILGKRLARKWSLPEQVTLAIWLHHSDTLAISEDMPEARISQVIQLADCVARQCGIGHSGSYDLPESTEELARSLGIHLGQLEQIGRDLAEKVEERCKVLGLESARAGATYGETAHTAAARLARDNSKLSLENRRLQTASSHLDFLKDFLLSIDSNSLPIDIAENFAVRWQKFYQTGMVCLYLAPSPHLPTLEGVVVETLAQARIVNLNVPLGAPAIPKALEREFVILDAGDNVNWLFEQLDVDFDVDQAKLLPLGANNKVVGGIVFELRYPGDAELFREHFRIVTSLAGSVLDMALSSASQEHFAEQFAHLLTKVKGTPLTTVRDTVTKEAKSEVARDSLAGLADMAGGAAHELNNPLSVISGRAQLLAQSETDPEKKRMLNQIRENAGEISQIINDLMTFAKPSSPRATQTDVRQMIDEAVQLTSQKARVEHINVQTEISDKLKTAFVDSAQIVSGVANIICNCLQSYAGGTGPIKIEADESGDFVRLQVSDLGCGMDEETAKRATQPFFSGQAAGRRRGMGLAHARRLIELNNGSLEIASQPGSGTTATVLLPCKAAQHPTAHSR
ncbi:MAG: HDOD domain-containing protein [Planctomycetota bacterium]|jgi:putative nucleotidyltransferase with HDIG domain